MPSALGLKFEFCLFYSQVVSNLDHPAKALDRETLRSIGATGIQIKARFIGRKGTRGRISVVTPAGAVFRSGYED